jgi:hypothetical protein
VAATGEQSPVAIVLSTLAIAALFSPLRRRIQNAIDRRFYRRKYDAEKELSAFGEAVRDEVELDRLAEELMGVVARTMQPESTSIWLRESDSSRSRRSGITAKRSPRTRSYEETGKAAIKPGLEARG